MSESFGRLHRRAFEQKQGWPDASVWDLACELLKRVGPAEAGVTDVAERAHLRLFTVLRNVLEEIVETPKNRMSVKYTADHTRFTVHCAQTWRLPIAGAAHLDVGCGAVNPFARMFTHLMAGARRVWCLELDDLEDEGEAVRVLARIAASALFDPRSVYGDAPITRRQIVDNLAGFDLPKLAAGDRSGLPSERLTLLKRSAADTGLPENSLDLVVSQSVLEHLTDVDAVLAELARVTRPGGFAIHGIDAIDHRWYGHPEQHPLEFLTVDAREPIVNQCNRLRLFQFEQLFAKHGFQVKERWVDKPWPIPAELRQRFVEPWKSMPDELLATTWTDYCLQKQ